MDDRTIVLTLYGTKEAISDFSISLFDKTGGFFKKGKAEEYCSNINELKLEGDNWIYAAIIKENQKTKLVKSGYVDFDILCSLDDSDIQKVIREIDNEVLKKALKFAREDILKAVLRNISRRAAYMLIDDLKHLDKIKMEEVKKARKQIADLIYFLNQTGEIFIPKASQDKVV